MSTGVGIGRAIDGEETITMILETTGIEMSARKLGTVIGTETGTRTGRGISAMTGGALGREKASEPADPRGNLIATKRGKDGGTMFVEIVETVIGPKMYALPVQVKFCG